MINQGSETVPAPSRTVVRHATGSNALSNDFVGKNRRTNTPGRKHRDKSHHRGKRRLALPQRTAPKVAPSATVISFNKMTRKLRDVHDIEIEKISPEMSKFMRGHVREFLGTQQPIFKLRTGFTTLTSSGTNLTQVVAMDVTGTTAWSSFANIFDEYRVRRASLHIIPLYKAYGSAATALAAMPIIVVVDYDDATAIASLTNAIQYDTEKILYLGNSNLKVLSAKEAYPEGQPDLAWVTTASPSTPFWWKFWSLTTLIPSSAAIGYCYIEAEIEFRQVA